MVKTVIKNVVLVVTMLAWFALTVFLVRLEDESIRTLAIVGMLFIAVNFLRIYAYFEMYYDCKNMYLNMRAVNKQRLFSFVEGKHMKVEEYTDWIELTGEDVLELCEKLKDKCFLTTKSLKRMSREVERMMNRRYPPI